MSKASSKTSKSKKEVIRRPSRIIFLDADACLRRQFTKPDVVVHCRSGQVWRVLTSFSRNDLWISPSRESTDQLLRNVSDFCARQQGLKSRIGNIIMLEPPRSDVLPLLYSLFARVVMEGIPFRLLPHEQLAEVLLNPTTESRDLILGGVVDIESKTLTVVRGDLEWTVVPLSIFRPTGVTQPDFQSFMLDDYGHTVRFGPYEAATDAILYEVDSDYRRRILAKRRSEEKGFGPSLRRLRLQRSLARDAFPGVAAKTIARLEGGKSSKPQGRTLRIIADTLQVEPNEIETF